LKSPSRERDKIGRRHLADPMAPSKGGPSGREGQRARALFFPPPLAVYVQHQVRSWERRTTQTRRADPAQGWGPLAARSTGTKQPAAFE